MYAVYKSYKKETFVSSSPLNFDDIMDEKCRVVNKDDWRPGSYDYQWETRRNDPPTCAVANCTMYDTCYDWMMEAGVEEDGYFDVGTPKMQERNSDGVCVPQDALKCEPMYQITEKCVPTFKTRFKFDRDRREWIPMVHDYVRDANRDCVFKPVGISPDDTIEIAKYQDDYDSNCPTKRFFCKDEDSGEDTEQYVLGFYDLNGDCDSNMNECGMVGDPYDCWRLDTENLYWSNDIYGKYIDPEDSSKFFYAHTRDLTNKWTNQTPPVYCVSAPNHPSPEDITECNPSVNEYGTYTSKVDPNCWIELVDNPDGYLYKKVDNEKRFDAANNYITCTNSQTCVDTNAMRSNYERISEDDTATYRKFELRCSSDMYYDNAAAIKCTPLSNCSSTSTEYESTSNNGYSFWQYDTDVAFTTSNNTCIQCSSTQVLSNIEPLEFNNTVCSNCPPQMIRRHDGDGVSCACPSPSSASSEYLTNTPEYRNNTCIVRCAPNSYTIEGNTHSKYVDGDDYETCYPHINHHQYTKNDEGSYESTPCAMGQYNMGNAYPTLTMSNACQNCHSYQYSDPTQYRGCTTCPNMRTGYESHFGFDRDVATANENGIAGCYEECIGDRNQKQYYDATTQSYANGTQCDAISCAESTYKYTLVHEETSTYVRSVRAMERSGSPSANPVCEGVQLDDEEISYTDQTKAREIQASGATYMCENVPKQLMKDMTIRAYGDTIQCACEDDRYIFDTNTNRCVLDTSCAEDEMWVEDIGCMKFCGHSQYVKFDGDGELQCQVCPDSGLMNNNQNIYLFDKFDNTYKDYTITKCFSNCPSGYTVKAGMSSLLHNNYNGNKYKLDACESNCGLIYKKNQGAYRNTGYTTDPNTVDVYSSNLDSVADFMGNEDVCTNDLDDLLLYNGKVYDKDFAEYTPTTVTNEPILHKCENSNMHLTLTPQAGGSLNTLVGCCEYNNSILDASFQCKTAKFNYVEDSVVNGVIKYRKETVYENEDGRPDILMTGVDSGIESNRNYYTLNSGTYTNVDVQTSQNIPSYLYACSNTDATIMVPKVNIDAQYLDKCCASDETLYKADCSSCQNTDFMIGTNNCLSITTFVGTYCIKFERAGSFLVLVQQIATGGLFMKNDSSLDLSVYKRLYFSVTNDSTSSSSFFKTTDDEYLSVSIVGGVETLALSTSAFAFYLYTSSTMGVILYKSDQLGYRSAEINVSDKIVFGKLDEVNNDGKYMKLDTKRMLRWVTCAYFSFARVSKGNCPTAPESYTLANIKEYSQSECKYACIQSPTRYVYYDESITDWPADACPFYECNEWITTSTSNLTVWTRTSTSKSDSSPCSEATPPQPSCPNPGEEGVKYVCNTDFECKTIDGAKKCVASACSNVHQALPVSNSLYGKSTTSTSIQPTRVFSNIGAKYNDDGTCVTSTACANGTSYNDYCTLYPSSSKVICPSSGIPQKVGDAYYCCPNDATTQYTVHFNNGDAICLVDNLQCGAEKILDLNSPSTNYCSDCVYSSLSEFPDSCCVNVHRGTITHLRYGTDCYERILSNDSVFTTVLYLSTDNGIIYPHTINGFSTNVQDADDDNNILFKIKNHGTYHLLYFMADDKEFFLKKVGNTMTVGPTENAADASPVVVYKKKATDADYLLGFQNGNKTYITHNMGLQALSNNSVSGSDYYKCEVDSGSVSPIKINIAIQCTSDWTTPLYKQNAPSTTWNKVAPPVVNGGYNCSGHSIKCLTTMIDTPGSDTAYRTIEKTVAYKECIPTRCDDCSVQDEVCVVDITDNADGKNDLNAAYYSIFGSSDVLPTGTDDTPIGTSRVTVESNTHSTTLTGAVTGSGMGTGAVTGTVTGSKTHGSMGNLAGTVAGTVTGTVTGAGTGTLTGSGTVTRPLPYAPVTVELSVTEPTGLSVPADVSLEVSLSLFLPMAAD